MGLKKAEDLTELTNSKKNLVDFCWKKERSMPELRKKLNVSNRRVEQIVSELNDSGILMYHSISGIRHFDLKHKKIIVKHETSKFLPYLYVMLFGTILSIMSSMFIIYSYKFLMGSISMMGIMLIFLIYKIFKTPDVTRYFYKTRRHRRI